MIESMQMGGADGKTVMSVKAQFLPESTDFRKTKKITWLAEVSDNIPAILTEYDHLISKPKVFSSMPEPEPEPEPEL